MKYSEQSIIYQSNILLSNTIPSDIVISKWTIQTSLVVGYYQLSWFNAPSWGDMSSRYLKLSLNKVINNWGNP